MWWLRYTRANSSVIPIIQMVGTGIFLGALTSQQYTWYEGLIPIFVYFCTGCLGITMTYHRYLTHRSFDLSKAKEYLFSLFAALGGTGSSIGWKSVHIPHHDHADTPLDPHSPSHLGLAILLGVYRVDFNKWTVRDLIVDPFHRFLHDYYHLILLVWGLVLASISMNALVLGFIIPMTIQIWASNLSNYFNHSSDPTEASDYDPERGPFWKRCLFAFLGILTFGESRRHVKLHHRFPWCAKYSTDGWSFDITYWMIRLFGKNPHLLGGVHEAQLR